MKIKQALITILLLILNLNVVFSQQIIELENPSFEDFPPRTGYTPSGWIDCGFKNESPPDIQPNSFNVEKPAFEGYTYLGMVTRDNDSWESVGQRLSSPLEANKTYSFSLALAKSNTYISRSRLTGEEADYITPIKLRIWGGNDYCEKMELLANSPVVDHTEWEVFDFFLLPKNNYNFIMLEAFYETSVIVPYCGNILIDNCSSIEEIPEDMLPEITKNIEEEKAKLQLGIEIDKEAKQKNTELLAKRAEEDRQKKIEETKKIEGSLVAKRQKKNDEFKQKVGTKELSEQDFLNIINTYPKKYLKGGKDKLVSRKFVKLYQAWEFEREVAQSGVKDYVFNHPQAYVRQTVAALTLVNARQKAEILHLTDKYANKPFKDKIKLELDYINNSNDLFTNVDEDVHQSILSFIKNNKTALTNEFLDFLNQ